VVAAAALSRTLEALLYDVRPADSLTLGATAALVALVSLAATLLPALRALRVDPAEALRSE
jgi:ABC-type lipoprotein release transport system permease subunit